MLLNDIPIPVFEEWVGQVSVQLFGKPDDWRLQKEGVLQISTVQRVRNVMKQHSTHELFSPNPHEMSARLVPRTRFVQVYTQKDEKSWFRVYRALGDGVFITPGQSALIASADCPTLVLAHKGNKAVVAHCGRDSLFKEMIGGKCVVENAFTHLRERSGEHFTAEDVRALVVGGISPHHFAHPDHHPQWGERNRTMITFAQKKWGPLSIFGEIHEGAFDLTQIIREELLRLGVLEEHIRHDGIDTFSNEDLWSNRAGDPGRNGVLVHVRNLS